MSDRGRAVLGWLVWGLVALLLVSVIAGQLLGQPVLLTYVETGSMEPTLEPGDAFIAIPQAIAGPVEAGDVIVFQASVLEGGGLTTHRVVDVRDGGYVTKGDANVGTDQEAGEPLVRDGQIVAVAWQVGGDIVVIPKIGLVGMAARSLIGSLRGFLAGVLGRPGLVGTQGFAFGLFAIGIGAYAIATWLEDDEDRRYIRTRRRPGTIDAGWLIIALAFGVALIATLSMAFPLGAQQFEMVSTENDAPGPRIVQAGTSETLNYTVPGGGLLPVVVILEPASDGLSVSPEQLYIRGGETVNATVTVTAPDDIGYAPQYLREHRYIALLPTPVIVWLYRLHPWVPILVIDILLAGGFILLGLAWLGGGQLRVRSRTATLSPVERIRRWL